MRILIVDDHAMFCESLITSLRPDMATAEFHSAGTLVEAEPLCRELKPDLVILDRILDEGSGFSLAKKLSAELPRTRWLGLTARNKLDSVEEAISCGLHGLVLKSGKMVHLQRGISAVFQGQQYFCEFTRRIMADNDRLEAERALTPRERSIWSMLRNGKNPKEIGGALKLVPKTVQNHITHLKRKIREKGRK